MIKQSGNFVVLDVLGASHRPQKAVGNNSGAYITAVYLPGFSLIDPTDQVMRVASCRQSRIYNSLVASRPALYCKAQNPFKAW